MKAKKMIPITKPFLPPFDEYIALIQEAFDRNWLTNNGPLVKQLESNLSHYLGHEHLLYVGNGTIAIQIAIHALNLSKKIVTTPFSYVATTSSIVWEHCTPVFADIDPRSLNIDPEKIEAVIDDKTEAILATHCYGNPCEIEKIKKVADRHNLKVIYDAAHCFGTLYKGSSVFHFGDVSTSSFHATKLFHTIEGGAVFTADQNVFERMRYMRNFGHAGPEVFASVGINGKNSEIHAAMGLVNLKYIDKILARRKSMCLHYDKLIQGLSIRRPKITEHATFNYAYYPVIFDSEGTTLAVKKALEESKIYPRRYFYPTLSSLPYINNGNTPIADKIAPCVMCLPLYDSLTIEEQNSVINVLKTILT